MPEGKRREEPSKTGQKGGETRREDKETHRGGESHTGGKGGEEHRR